MGHGLIKWFSEISLGDLSLVGGKNASLGEMIGTLKSRQINVPFGFAITTEAYNQFLDENNIRKPIFDALNSLDVDNIAKLKTCSAVITDLIGRAHFSKELSSDILSHYEALKKDRQDFRVAVRSSSSAEDLPNASFAGQQDTYLHVKDADELLKRVKDVYASLFSERAIAYRVHNNFDHEHVAISVGVQEMVNSDQGVSGVMFTLDPESGFKDVIFINASYGLGEGVVSGAINPDEFTIYKPQAKNQLVVLGKKLGSKAFRLAFSQNAREIVEEPNDHAARDRFCLSDDDLSTLAKSAVIIEQHYRRPMDIEWAKDGVTGDIFILQARPETVHANPKNHETFTSHIEGSPTVLCIGRAVGKLIGQGRARILQNIEDGLDFLNGEVLVTDMTDPSWEPIMKKASAIVTNRGGRTCHAAIIAREMGIPAVVGCGDATQKISDKANITVSCADGDDGKVYSGLVPIIKKPVAISHDGKSPVPLMMIAANPGLAFFHHFLKHEGIGLARLEFIIANTIGVHPNAILKINEMPKEIKQEILHRSRHHKDPVDFYVDSLATGISSLAAVAAPHPIIVRLSDFKTNEYEELLGGSLFEHKENNPMIGFRGASRYISPLFADAFKLECEALIKARNQYGFNNIQVMIPFVRTLNEAEQVTKLLKKNGLKRGENGLKVIMMCEIPSNVILADQFLEYFDGFSIGSNDLTQLTLGIDRDSHMISGEFKESDPSLLKMFELAILACKRNHKYVGICGQGPSDNIDLARYLISLGIDSISLTPDALMETHGKLAG